MELIRCAITGVALSWFVAASYASVATAGSVYFVGQQGVYVQKSLAVHDVNSPNMTRDIHFLAPSCAAQVRGKGGVPGSRVYAMVPPQTPSASVFDVPLERLQQRRDPPAVTRASEPNERVVVETSGSPTDDCLEHWIIDKRFRVGILVGVALAALFGGKRLLRLLLAWLV